MPGQGLIEQLSQAVYRDGRRVGPELPVGSVVLIDRANDALGVSFAVPPLAVFVTQGDDNISAVQVLLVLQKDIVLHAVAS